MKVWPTSDVMRKILRHPGGSKMPFPSSGGLDWPDDQFTHRRIVDGDVTTVDPSPPAAELTPLLASESTPLPSSTPVAFSPAVVAEDVHNFGTDHTKPPITKPPVPKKSKGE